MSEVDLLSCGLEHCRTLLLGAQHCNHMFSSRWQLVDYRHVEVAVDSHGQCPRNRSGGHHQHMRRNHAFGPEACALRHSEAVLFVDYGKPEVAEFDLVLNNGMSAHKDMQRTFGELCRYEASFLCFRASGEQPHVESELRRHGADCLEVLGGENLGGGHQAGLESVVDCQKHAHQGHNGFAAAYIALYEAVHLAPRQQVGTYFLHHTFLCSGECEG